MNLLENIVKNMCKNPGNKVLNNSRNKQQSFPLFFHSRKTASMAIGSQFSRYSQALLLLLNIAIT
jgi:hypothetical protein